MGLLFTFTFTTLLFSYVTTLISSQEMYNDTVMNESTQQSPNLLDSRIEHVIVKPRTGFDGKVHSIQIGIDSDESSNNVDKRQSQNHTTDIDATEINFSTTETDLGSRDGHNLSNNKESLTTDTSKEITSANESSYETTTSGIIHLTNVLRKRRSISVQSAAKNNLNDLQAEEAKVFRPLFVYRYQVNKRLKPQKEKSGISGHGSQRIKSNSHRNYHPYRYSPYRYYPSG